MPRAKQTLTLDEQLAAFLDDWESRRKALVHKHKERAKRWRDTPMLYDYELRAQRHYEHELRMLQELRRRAFTIVVRSRTLQAQVTRQESDR